jgi:hypothetical protein
VLAFSRGKRPERKEQISECEDDPEKGTTVVQHTLTNTLLDGWSGGGGGGGEEEGGKRGHVSNEDV